MYARDPIGCKLLSSETLQHFCSSARDCQMRCAQSTQEERTSHVRASTPQLRAKASRLQPGPPCPIPACALEPLPCSSMVSAPVLSLQDTGKLPWPLPSFPVHHRAVPASQIHFLIHTTEPSLCSAEHCSKSLLDSETQRAPWLQLVSQGTESFRLVRPCKITSSNHPPSTARSTVKPCPQMPHPHIF